ncbi:MAG TPA: class I SAM-dependent methyltransferase [Candidatus Limnocylindrales bacterium]|nr:class I SAM-dependent methyltransferase [Candidatus Limnocylindrales bacterium]
MTSLRAHALLDAGEERRLERFGDVVVDRPAPTAGEPKRDPAAWASADLVFRRYVGWTAVADEGPRPWVVADGDLRFELRPSESGQVGLFPEQAANRAWVAQQLLRAREAEGMERQPTLLNLFAYTGAVTLAAAAAGAAVTHVDGSRPSVAWARRNAELSGLADRPVRWIVDDAAAFVAREIRRGRRYDAVVLDPPSYGHAPGGRTWRLEERLAELLDACAALTGGDPLFALASAHTPGFGPDRLADELAAAYRRRLGQVERGELILRAESGARLRLGAWARIIRR